MPDEPQTSRVVPVSTVLLTKNCGKTLPAYFESMRNIDDIILLDGGSTDDTLAVAGQFANCRVFSQPAEHLSAEGFITDFSAVRNYGYSLAKHPWILCIDADETLDPVLEKAVTEVIEQNKIGVYYVNRQFYVNDKPVVMFKRSSSDQIRLFHLEAAPGCVKPIHERLNVQPNAYKGLLPGSVSVPLEYSPSVRAKHNRYLALEVANNTCITWFTWMRWIFLRNIISVTRLLILQLLTYFIPKRGPRFPLRLTYEVVRYKILLTWRTCPLWRG